MSCRGFEGTAERAKVGDVLKVRPGGVHTHGATPHMDGLLHGQSLFSFGGGPKDSAVDGRKYSRKIDYGVLMDRIIDHYYLLADTC